MLGERRIIHYPQKRIIGLYVTNVTYVSKERLDDPEWKPPFDAGVVITNFAFNGDESTPHLHMTFVPYSDNCSRGQKT